MSYFIFAEVLVRALSSSLRLRDEDELQVAIAKLAVSALNKNLRSIYLKTAPSAYQELIQAHDHDDISRPMLIKFLRATLINNDELMRAIFPYIERIIHPSPDVPNVSRDPELQKILDEFKVYLSGLVWPSFDILDRREYFAIDPSQRFLTYFAALLKLKPGLSVCSAITIAPALSGSGLQLYIACNLSNDKPATKLELLQTLYARLALIQGFLDEIRVDPFGACYPSLARESTETDADEFKSSLFTPSPVKSMTSRFVFGPPSETIRSEMDCSEFAIRLLRILGFTKDLSPQDKTVLITAKVIYALCFDQEQRILPPSFLALFQCLSLAKVILPKITAIDSSLIKYLHAEFYAKSEEDKIVLEQCVPIFDLKRLRADQQVIRLIHAEQLLVFVLDQLGKKPEAVGINLLCCLTCSLVLSKMQVKFYGVHHKADTGVLNFLDQVPQSPRGSRFFIHVLAPKPTPPRSVAGAAARVVEEPKCEVDEADLLLPPKLSRTAFSLNGWSADGSDEDKLDCFIGK